MNICKLVLEYIEQYPKDEPIFIEDIKKYVIQQILTFIYINLLIL